MRMDPKKHDIWISIMEIFEGPNGIFNNKEPLKKDYEPYLADLIKNVEAARKANPEKTVCCAFALFKKSWRDYIR